MSDDLLVMIKRLRIENEVNKVLMGSLIQYLLNKNKNELIDECLESINFTAEIVESQINKSWSEGEAELT